MDKIIVIAGITGFIGKALAQLFLEKGYRIKGLTRGEEKAVKLKAEGIEPLIWDGFSLGGREKQLENVAGVINLSGQNIAAGRWTQKKKRAILNSRKGPVRVLTEGMKLLKYKPRIFIQASAVGYYGHCGNKEITETQPPGRGFLSRVVKQWEDASKDIENLAIRRIICRFGMVLGKNGGALARLLLPYRLFVGGPLGSGEQWVSWIHLDDLVNAIEYLLTYEKSSGIYNFTAPKPVTNREFSHLLGNVLHRPSFLPVPAWMLKTLFGEMADEVLLSSQKVFPSHLLKEGFKFQYPDLDQALKSILSK